MTRSLTLALLIAFAMSIASVPFTVNHLHSMGRVTLSDAVQSLSPLAFYTLGEWNSKTNQKRSVMFAVDLNSNESRLIAPSAWSSFDVSPKLLPESRQVLFLSTRSGGEMRPFTVPLSGGQPVPLADFELPKNMGMDNLIIAPNSKYFLFTTSVFHDCNDLKCTSERLEEQGNQDHKIYDDLYVRHWDTWSDHTVQHIFLQELRVNSTSGIVYASGAPRDLLKGLKIDAPVKPFGGTEQIAISPDSKTIAFTGEAISHDTAWRTDWNTYIIDAEEGAPKCLTEDYKARTQNPVFSPDGKTLYFGAMQIPGAESDRVRITAYDIESGKKTTIADKWDRSVDQIIVDPSGEYLLVEAYDSGLSKVFSISLKDETVTELISSGANHGIQRLRGGESNLYVLARNTIQAPNDIFSFSFTAPEPVQLKQHTDENKHILTTVNMVEPEMFRFPCEDPQPDDGKGCQAWILKPLGYVAGKKYPVAHLVHGGPEGVWDDSWSYRWNPQLWASRGYFVLMINPQGSTSFGQKFTEGVLNNWGGTPYRTLQKGLDAFLDKYKDADPNRLGYAGASYGGFMAAWTATQTNRYKAIAMHDGVFDTLIQGYETEELFFAEHEFGGTPYDNLEGYEKYNPRRFVQNIDVNQKILVIQGGKDYRIIEGQGISMFTALRRRGITSRLLYFPNENHWVLKQLNSIEWYNQVLGWFDKYVV